MQMVRSLWNYRGVIVDKVTQDFLGKYRRSLLGVSWMVIEPLSMIIIYTLIFSTVMGAKMQGNDNPWAYSIHLCSGLLCWELFQQVISRSSGVFIEQANLIKKSNFPRSILPLVIAISSSFQYVIFFLIFAVFLAVIGQFPTQAVLALPFGFLSVLILAIGIGLIVGILNVFFRDVSRLVIVTLNFLFWGTPIVYSLELVPEQFSNIILLINPLASIVEFHHKIFLFNQIPNLELLLFPTLTGLFLCLFGFWLFLRLEGEIVDEL